MLKPYLVSLFAGLIGDDYEITIEYVTSGSVIVAASVGANE